LQLLLALPAQSILKSRVPRASRPHFTASDSRLPQPGGLSPLIYLLGIGCLGYTPGTGFPYRRLLLLAGLRWRYLTSPPHVTYVYNPSANRTENLFHYCVFYRCRGNVSTGLLPSNDCYTVPSLHSSYLSVVLHVTILNSIRRM
jgi:hypothetical protein